MQIWCIKIILEKISLFQDTPSISNTRIHGDWRALCWILLNEIHSNFSATKRLNKVQLRFLNEYIFLSQRAKRSAATETTFMFIHVISKFKVCFYFGGHSDFPADVNNEPHTRTDAYRVCRSFSMSLPVLGSWPCSFSV